MISKCIVLSLASLALSVNGQVVEPPIPEAPAAPVAEYKAPISCLGSISDCVTCPAELLCTDISIGRLPEKPQTDDWINDACACICPNGPAACIPLDSSEAEAAIEAAREATASALEEAAGVSRDAFAAAINATVPEGIEKGSEEYMTWRMNLYMDAFDTHKNVTHEALLGSQDERLAAIEALKDMFGHGHAPGPEPAPEPAVADI